MPIRNLRAMFILAVPSLFALVPAIADAHPIDVLRASSEVYLSNGWGRHDGRYVRMGHEAVSKSSGTLDMSVPYSAVGIDAPGSLLLTGTRHGEEVWWDFDQPLNVSIDDLNWTRHIDGRLVTRVREMGAATRLNCAGGPCPYSLFLDGYDRGSWVRLHGTTWPFIEWSEVADLGFEMFSGPPRPRLQRFEMTRTGGVCSRKSDRRFNAELVLDHPAPSRGTLVELVSHDPQIRIPRRLRVAAGDQRGTLVVDVPGGYTGSFDISAAAGGIQLSQTLSVGPSVFCLPDHLVFALDDIESDIVCRGCLDDLQLADHGIAVGTVSGKSFLRDSEGYIVSLSDMVGEKVGAVSLGDRGDVAARLLETGDTVVWPRVELGAEPVLLSQFVARGIDARGTVFGAWNGKGELLPAYIAHGQVVVPPLGVWMAQLEDSTQPGLAIGTIEGKQPVSFLTTGKKSWTPKFAKGGHIASVNAAGDVVGTYLAKESPLAFLGSLHGGKPMLIQNPGGLGTVAMGVDEAGTVVVNLTKHPDKPSQGVALWSGETGLVPIEDLLKADAYVTVEEVLRVNQAFDLSVRGTIDGEPAIFGLRNLSAWGTKQ